MARLLVRLACCFGLTTVATGFAYYLDVRRDLVLGVGFYLFSVLLTIAIAITGRVENPALVATASAAGTFTALVLGFAWRLPVADGDGLWVFAYGYLSALVIIEWLISWELGARRAE
ncbi:MAG: hypothetical protein Q7V57_01685 [Actinomycetota bacterium]|nr:hypothetical protein [Actinomycetota bacterium]